MRCLDFSIKASINGCNTEVAGIQGLEIARFHCICPTKPCQLQLDLLNDEPVRLTFNFISGLNISSMVVLKLMLLITLNKTKLAENWPSTWLNRQVIMTIAYVNLAIMCQ